MVEERHLIKSEAEVIPTEAEETKVQLQKEMASARNSITNTLNEIGDTVSTQTQAVRTAIENTLDLREHIRRHPKVIGIGAAALGFAAGYTLISSMTNRNGSQRVHRNQETLADQVQAAPAWEPHQKQNGLWDKFKTTRAYQRLSSEASTAAEQVISDIFKVGKEAVLPLATSFLRQGLLPKLEGKPQQQPDDNPEPILTAEG